MRFLVDAQLPPALASWLKARGHDAEHVLDRLGVTCPDRLIAVESIASGAIVVSKDSDFLNLQAEGKPQVIWVRSGNTTNQQLLKLFEAEWDRVLAALTNGEPVVELE